MPYKKRAILTAVASGALLAICVAMTTCNAQTADPAQTYMLPANFDTVQDLYEACTSEDGGLRTVCAAYIAGIASLMGPIGSTRNVGLATRAYGVCSKSTISLGAFVQAFKNWATKHPEMWSHPMVLGVLVSLRGTWPCP